ncbi:response regulator transcription factor [Stenotrophomonas sp. MMGLT7]|uniref:response regulator transcription factor n=1 Tax=Stenotrophomonas sp. MMGLT7 TaxID=2901227 RepID=UPI001E5B8D47|nr:response regulator transcription factor [Stenotrophomonas sp. MMGLT7]MCD7099719.1 response regulator transcription factor [Stenotrophomonas sp. MMGLT7]
MRILLVEDDPSLGETLQAWLRLDGYTVDWLTRGDQARTALLAQPYQCILLDRGLPGLDGDALLQALRASQLATPVLMITARDTLEDRVQGLDLGADDYLVKPFDLEELSARIRAALRRGAGNATVLLSHGEVALDPVAKRVTRGGEPVALTAREYAVAHALLLRKGHIVGRGQLEDALYGWGEEVESNAIEVHISHLRKKLGSDFIVTVRRQGYCVGAPR